MQLRLLFDSPDPRPAAPLPPNDLPVVLLVRHRRARRYLLRVLPDGRVRLTMPWRGSKREALAFLESQRAWVEAQRSQRRERRSQVPRGALAPFVERWHRARAERELPARLLALATTHNITVSRVTVRDQRSRWGACSSTGAITLNWRLIRVPAFVCEYVMLHELMHRRELNHSRRFWRLVAECCPRHVEARRWLRTEGRRLWAECE